MNALALSDLSVSQDLDRQAMADISGGLGFYPGGCYKPKYCFPQGYTKTYYEHGHWTPEGTSQDFLGNVWTPCGFKDKIRITSCFTRTSRKKVVTIKYA